MTSLTQFTFHDDHHVRVLIENGEPLFHANDLCAVLEYVNPRDAVRRHTEKDDVVKRDTIDSLGRKQQSNFVLEPGMWALVLGSETAKAKAVKRWVTSEVLPAIRKTGRYIAPKPVDKRNYMSNSDMLNIKRLIYSCNHHMDYKESFNHAVWFCLREVTGVPSPAKFEVEHLGAIAQEFNRIFSIVVPYYEAKREAELEIIKQLIRNRGGEHILIKALNNIRRSAKEHQLNLKMHIDRNFNVEISNLLTRRPNGYDHSDCNEVV